MPKGIKGFQKGHANFRKDPEHSFYKPCLNCGKEFKVQPRSVKRGAGKYCSNECRLEYWNKTGILKGRIAPNKEKRTGKMVVCQNCGKEFYVIPSQFKYRNPRYCSYECRKKEQIWNKGLTKETDKRVLKYADSHRAEKSRFWKGGISDLRNLIRNTFTYKKWRMAVYRRDCFLCKECNSKSNGLNAHHIKPFSDLFQEFLSQYSQFSPIEDKETLLRLSESYEPFWKIDNGITLCEKCHNKTRVGVS